MVEILTEDNFNAAVEGADVPVLVDCFATWCGPCKMMAPIVDDISETFDGKIRVYKVDVDEAPKVARDFGIMSIPTFLLFKNGELVNKMVGTMGEEDFEAAVQAVLD